MKEDDSMLSLAKKYFAEISKLSASKKPADRLLVYNSIFVFLILTVVISFSLLNNNFKDIFLTIIIIVVSGIFAAILSRIHLFILEKIFEITHNSIIPHKFTIPILFLSFLVAIAGLIFYLKIAISISIVLIFVQLVVLLFVGYLKKPQTEVIVNLPVNAEVIIENKANGATSNATLANVVLWVGLISGVVTIATFILKIFKIF